MVYEQIIGPILQLIDTIFIYLNTLVYDFISFLYQIFIAIAGAQIFTSEQYQTIANRVYIVIGVVSLFIISYALLRAIIDPDNASKGEYSVSKIIPNVIKVILLIAFVPAIFSVAYRVQDVVVNTNVIPKIIVGNDYKSSDVESEDGEYSYKRAGRSLANEIWTGFMYPKDGVDAQDIEINSCYFPAPDCEGIEDTSTLGKALKYLSIIKKVGDYLTNPLAAIGANYITKIIGDNTDKLNSSDRAYTFADAVIEVNYGEKNYQVYANFGNKIHGEKKQLEYNGIFQLIAGIIVVYVFINYCIDLGVRAIKLGYYQLIAPVAILTILIPGQNKVFSNWLKSSISTFIDVFIRIALIFLGLLAINTLPQLGEGLWANSMFADNLAVQGFARVFIIIGILIFIKQAPKLISDLFGIQGGAFKLGIKDKLGEMVGVGDVAKDALSHVPSVGGALTGAAGGAWTAAWNKGKVWDAAKLGALNGAKGGGKQFNKQRNYMWEDVYGMRGPAGWFGGRPIYNKAVDELKNKVNDEFLQYDESKGLGTNSRTIKEIEKSKQFTAIYNEHHKKLEDAINNLANAEQTYAGNIQNLQGTISNLNSDLNVSKGNYEKYNDDYNSKMKDIQQIYTDHLKSAREMAIESGDTAKVLAYGQKIQEVQNGMATQDAVNYVKSTDTNKYNDLQNTIARRDIAKKDMDTINSNLERYKIQLNNETNLMNNDQKVLDARKTLDSLGIKDENGNNILNANQLSTKDIEKYAQDKARAQYRKENDEYAWRVAAEEKEKREVDIKKAKTNSDNQAMAELLGDIIKKNSSSGDKK